MNDPTFDRWILSMEKISIKDRLANGPYGDCYVGTVDGTNEHVVVKYLRQFTNGRDEYFKHITGIAESGCPAIVRLVGLSFSETNSSVITEYAPMGTFAQALSYHQKFSRWPIGFGKVQMACLHYGIAYTMSLLHEKNIIHGSLKPENVLFAKKYAPLLTDLSQANYCPKPNKKRFRPKDILYMAPEVLKGETITSKSDIYSFGMLLFSSYCPKVPLTIGDGHPIDFSGRRDIADAIKKGERFSRPENITDGYWSLICQCWNHDPDQRPDFKEILATLDSFELFPKQSRDLLHYRKYIQGLEGTISNSDIQKETLLFSERTYKKAISKLSLDVVSAGAAVTLRHRKISSVRFQCRYCDVQYNLELDMNDKIWNVFRIGDHVGHEKKNGRPITEHLKNCISAGVAKGKSGSHLVKFVRKKNRL